MTLAQLKSYDFGSWKDAEYAGTTIPTLAEALLDAKKYGYELQLEPKENWTDEQVSLVVNLITGLSMEKSVSFNGFAAYTFIKIHMLCDKIDIKRSCTEITEETIAATMSNGIKGENNNTLLHIQYEKLTEEGLELAKAAGCKVHVWFANSISVYEELAGKYVSEVTTDFLNPVEYYLD